MGISSEGQVRKGNAKSVAIWPSPNIESGVSNIEDMVRGRIFLVVVVVFLVSGEVSIKMSYRERYLHRPRGDAYEDSLQSIS